MHPSAMLRAQKSEEDGFGEEAPLASSSFVDDKARVSRSPSRRRDSVSSATLGFDDLNDFCAPASLQATEQTLRTLRRCILRYGATSSGAIDPYVQELLGPAKARAVMADESRLKMLVESADADLRTDEVGHKARGLFRKVHAAMKLKKQEEAPQDDAREVDELAEHPPDDTVKRTKRSSRRESRRRSSQEATKVAGAPKSPKKARRVSAAGQDKVELPPLSPSKKKG
ncbi:unnamed protein product [Symbiodinium natans]|uniref:Uncharacterized protein n=1 Tax=Symbiodinium natans TaxID=878477 RepID=A0A812PTU6_9DINO|nr:unnamed protein product [Symbiodinium natans]